MRIAAGIEYNGSRYCGWQRQSHSPSVQAEVESALGRVADHPVHLFCAGRTDTGVHASNQVVHFDTDAQRPDKAWVLGGNAHLPDDISILWARPVDDSFHARFSALERRYRYIILEQQARPAILAGGLTHCAWPLDVDLMQAACRYFPGEQDFTSFQAASCQSPTAWRNVHHLSVSRRGAYIVIEIAANAFLHHMVRNIAGTLMVIGRGQQSPEWAGELLSLKDRTRAAMTASAKGLYLVQVRYPRRHELPGRPCGPLFLDAGI